MVEQSVDVQMATKSPSQKLVEIHELNNGAPPRTLRSLTSMPQSQNLLASDMTFSSNRMDGVLKVFNPVTSLLQKAESKVGILGQTELAVMAVDYFVESSYGVMDADYIQAQRQATSAMEEFFVVGLDDGTVHAYAYTKNKGKSFTKRVISGGESSQPKDIDGPYDQFCDSTYEHQDSIVSV